MMFRVPRGLLAAAILLAAACAHPAAAAEGGSPARPAGATAEYRIAAGDVVRVSVFQSPDLTLETRVDENGNISYPLVGTVALSGLTVSDGEQRIAKMLRDGGYMVAPHVTIVVVQIRGNQVTILGQVTKPGRFPLDSVDSRVTDLIALAGGISASGADVVVLTGTREGKPMRREIDIQKLANDPGATENIELRSGDLLYVNRAPTFYIYGEVQRPGTYRLERGMTVMQALATGGGLTPKGTQHGLTIHRRDASGNIAVIEPRLDDAILADDVLYIRESLF